MDATYRAIGCFITHFSGVEEVMRDYLALKVGLALQDYNAVITHDFALLCTAVEEVFGRTLDAQNKKHLRGLISRARELNIQRVKVVHGQWWPDHEGGTLWHISRQNLRAKVSGKMAISLNHQTELARELMVQMRVFFEQECP
ncbi:hypothetical protein [Bradyrhizobium guangdongense]|uniref:hypothetical protein n=1 Tax=Bradyrhizobium guangdongense TaxID=1325090 RepID=UPI001319CCAA|nr:hypothetical protein [Bradyrhizobium guangdongense]